MDISTVAGPLAGGALIGISAILMMLFNGRVAGISGILNGIFRFQRDGAWRWMFIGGLLASGVIAAIFWPVYDTVGEEGVAMFLAAGFLVGVGTRYGGGCTSGHGICGIGRLSKRSIVATLVFMTSGAIAAVVFN